MTIAESLLPEVDHEMASTRRLLECVPEVHAGFRPHERSWTLGELASHLSNLPQWATMTLQTGEFDLNPDGTGTPTFPPFSSVTEALDRFDANVTAARQALAASSDQDLAVPWTLLSHGEPVFSMPRLAVLRSFVLNHIVHHRGQLTVYLRMCDVPLPQTYGPTADSGLA